MWPLLLLACHPDAPPGAPPADPPDTSAAIIEEIDEQGFLVDCGGRPLRVEATTAGIIRARYGPAGRPSDAVLPGGPPAHPVIIDEGDRLRLTEGDLSATLTRADCRLTLTDADGAVLLDEPAGGGWIGPGTLLRTLPAEAHVYGFGGRTGPLDRRGRQLRCHTTDAYDPAAGGYAIDADPLYQCIPFYITHNGPVAIGVFTDTPEDSAWDIGATNPSLLRLDTAGTIDQHYIAGPSVGEVLDRYTRLTGRPPLPPAAALGFHQSRWGWPDADAVRAVVDQYAALDLPLDGIWLDIQHMDGFRIFTWDPATYGDPDGLIADLAAQGVAAYAIVDPGIKVDPGYAVYDAFLAAGLLLMKEEAPYAGIVWPGLSVFPDFSDPAARAAWGDWVGAELAHGLAGLWLDMNEPAVFDGSDADADAIVGAGEGQPRSLTSLRNVYALLEARATYEGAQAAFPSRRPFLLSRSGYAGIQRYAAAWTGDAPSDWPTLTGTPAMLLGMALSGEAWVGSDVGGYSGGASPELFARWMQVGLFSPFFRAHLTQGAADQYPWSFGTEVTDISRSLLQERRRLRPTLYNLGQIAAATGAPPLRPLAFADPTIATDDQLLWGDDILVAPILTEGATSRRVELPAGRWFEWQTGAAFDGPATLLREGLPLASLPVFVRAGGLLARAPADPAEPPLTLELWPAAEAVRRTLYEDAGDGDGPSRITTLSAAPTEGGLQLTLSREGAYDPGRASLRLRLPRIDAAPAALRLDGAPLDALDAAALQAGRTGYAWDPVDLSLAINLPDAGTQTLDLTVDTALSALAPPVAMPFRVTVPAGTPTDTPIAIATAADGWTVHHPLTWLGPTEAAGSVTVARGEYVYYKYTRGDWETVEKWPDCAEAANRYEMGRAAEKVDTVYAWRDQCP